MIALIHPPPFIELGFDLIIHALPPPEHSGYLLIIEEGTPSLPAQQSSISQSRPEQSNLSPTLGPTLHNQSFLNPTSKKKSHRVNIYNLRSLLQCLCPCDPKQPININYLYAIATEFHTHTKNRFILQIPFDITTLPKNSIAILKHPQPRSFDVVMNYIPYIIDSLIPTRNIELPSILISRSFFNATHTLTPQRTLNLTIHENPVEVLPLLYNNEEISLRYNGYQITIFNQPRVPDAYAREKLYALLCASNIRMTLLEHLNIKALLERYRGQLRVQIMDPAPPCQII